MRSESQWYDLIHQWEAGQLTQVAFCLQHNVPLDRFKFYRRKGLVSGVFTKQWHVQRQRGSGFTKLSFSADNLDVGANHSLHNHKSKGQSQGETLPITASASSGPSADDHSTIEINLPYGIILRIPCARSA